MKQVRRAGGSLLASASDFAPTAEHGICRQDPKWEPDGLATKSGSVRGRRSAPCRPHSSDDCLSCLCHRSGGHCGSKRLQSAQIAT